MANGDTPDKVLCENFLAVQDSSIGNLVTHSLTHSLTDLWFQRYNDYNYYNDYNDYNYYNYNNDYYNNNDYRDSDLGLDWGRFSELVT